MQIGADAKYFAGYTKSSGKNSGVTGTTEASGFAGKFGDYWELHKQCALEDSDTHKSKISDEQNQTEDTVELLKEKMNEILDKLRKGNTETRFRIGAQSFTEKEWDRLLERFDSAEDAVRELMKEEQEQRTI